jgi:hypothetical protein
VNDVRTGLNLLTFELLFSTQGKAERKKPKTQQQQQLVSLFNHGSGKCNLPLMPLAPA